MRARRILPAGLAVAGAAAMGLALAGCGEAEAKKTYVPVRFATPGPPHGHIGVRARGDQVVPASRWPNACHYLSDADVRAILPQATSFQRTPGKVTVINLFDGKETGDRSNVAQAGSCLTNFWLDGVTIKDVTSGIKVQTEAVAGRKPLTRFYKRERHRAFQRSDTKIEKNLGGRVGPEACYLIARSDVDSQLTCRQGPLMYTLSGIGYGDMGVPDDNQPAQRAAWLHRVLMPAAKTIAAKVG